MAAEIAPFWQLAHFSEGRKYLVDTQVTWLYRCAFSNTVCWCLRPIPTMSDTDRSGFKLKAFRITDAV